MREYVLPVRGEAQQESETSRGFKVSKNPNNDGA
jgi:hypothetical protein